MNKSVYFKHKARLNINASIQPCDSFSSEHAKCIDIERLAKIVTLL